MPIRVNDTGIYLDEPLTELKGKIKPLLASTQKVISINVAENALKKDALTYLFSLLNKGKSDKFSCLEKLVVSGGDITVMGATALAQYLTGNNTLVYLDLAYCQLNTASLEILFNALRHSAVQWLDLSFNPIGDDPLFDRLQGNTALNCLLLDYCNIGPLGGLSVARFLASNNTLNRLYLGGNPLGDKGVTPVMNALRSNSALHTLGLNQTGLTNAALFSDYFAYFKSRVRSSALHTLFVDGNGFDESNGQEIITILAAWHQQSPHFFSLLFHSNEISAELRVKIRASHNHLIAPTYQVTAEEFTLLVIQDLATRLSCKTMLGFFQISIEHIIAINNSYNTDKHGAVKQAAVDTLFISDAPFTQNTLGLLSQYSGLKKLTILNGNNALDSVERMALK